MKHEEFITTLRSALHYLYDPDQLRRSSLAAILGVADRIDASAAVQKVLLEAIEALKPDDDEPAQSRAWLSYDVLFFRYVRGYDRTSVANQLGISDRQFSREQRTAIEALGVYLWETYRLGEQSQLSDTAQSTPADAAGLPVPSDSVDTSNVDWGSLPPEKPAAWKGVLLSVLDLVRPLAAANEIRLLYEPDENLPDLVVPQHALRHALLNVLSAVLDATSRGTLEIVVRVPEETVEISIEAVSAGAPPPASFESAQPSLEVVRHLVERAGGQFEVKVEAGRIRAALAMPALEQIPVLVVDDNADVVQLFQRYAQGTRYAVIGTTDPLEALRTAERICPKIILLDIMMPEMDGWELLQQIRQALPAGVSIIVCSILPQENLALSLGADAFLRKPVLPQAFLEALDQQLEGNGT